MAYRIPSIRKMRSLVNEVLVTEGKVWHQLGVVICSDEYLKEMNKKHLSHDYYTDILTFDYSSKATPGTGELYISLDRVRENAKEHSVPLAHELNRVIIHGVLHLCGYKDGNPKDKQTMSAREDFYLAHYGGGNVSTWNII